MKSGKRRLNYFIVLLVLSASWDAYAEDVIFEANESPPFWSQDLPFQGMGGEIIQAISPSQSRHKQSQVRELGPHQQLLVISK